MPTNDFTSADPQGAFWLVGFTASTGETIGYRCRVNGDTFVRSLQDRLHREPAAASFDGNRYAGSMVATDGRWGPLTFHVLWSALRAAGAAPELLTVVASDAGWRGRGRPRATPTISRNSLLGAIWLMHQAPVSNVAGGVPLSALAVPEDAVLPRYMQAGARASGDGSGATCDLLAYDDPQTPLATTPTPPPVPPPDATTAADPEPNPTPAPRDVTDDIVRPDGSRPNAAPGSQIPWGIVLAAVAAVGVIGLVTVGSGARVAGKTPVAPRRGAKTRG